MEHSYDVKLLEILTIILQDLSVSPFPIFTDTAFYTVDSGMNVGHKPVFIKAGRRGGKENVGR